MDTNPTGEGPHAQLLLLSQEEVDRLLDLDQLEAALATALQDLSAGRASVPARTAAIVPDAGLLAAMPGYSPNTSLAVKLVSVFPGNHVRGLPSHNALIALFDAETGRATAILDGTRITAARTAAISALTTRHLARPDAATLAIVGAGVQGEAHLAAVSRTRNFQRILVASRNAEHAAALAEKHPGASSAESVEAAAREADVICACTDAAAPVVRREWLKPHAHVTSVGFSGEGAELDPDIVDQAIAAQALFVESRQAFAAFPAGAQELQGRDARAATEVGELLSDPSRFQGAAARLPFTLYKSVGVAIEDAAAAAVVYERARGSGAGLPIRL